MKQEKYSNINTEAFDFKYIYRSLKKYLIYILAVTCVTGTLSYIFLDQYMQNTYKASVNLYVIPRDNSANKFYTTGMDTAVSRFICKYRNWNKCHCDECNEQFG